uniref:Sfi1 spindle body domain-containing protein n=1 Tax=Leptocylindrus danicus TaxID=163516 RepID=A0A7S2K582_9STRA|mmetsp:Transcript_1664/g.2481  ORF Transcript_1664/g.2481 Transcript_1664/m.2481 type:complete len:466 (+) Transcript_1664:154-1551(+)
MMVLGKRVEVSTLDPVLPNETNTPPEKSWSKPTSLPCDRFEETAMKYDAHTKSLAATDCLILKRRVLRAFIHHSIDAKLHRRRKQIAGHFQLIRYFLQWQNFGALQKIKRRSLTKYFYLWRKYTSIETAEQEYCRKVRMAAFHRSKCTKTRTLLRFKKSVEIRRNSEQCAEFHASNLICKRSMSIWNAIVQKKRVKKRNIATMNNILFDGYLRFLLESLSRWKKYIARQKQIEFVDCLVSRVYHTVLLKQSIFCWVDWVHSERRVRERKRHEIRRIIWRWRSFTENSLRWKHKRRKALSHLAKSLCKRVFRQWCMYAIEKKSNRRQETTAWRNALLSRLDDESYIHELNPKALPKSTDMPSRSSNSGCVKGAHQSVRVCGGVVDNCMEKPRYLSSDEIPKVKIPLWIAEKLKEKENTNIRQVSSKESEPAIPMIHSSGTLLASLEPQLITPNVPKWIALELQKLD